MKKVVGQLFPRNRYPGGTAAKFFFSKNRAELQKVLGGATKVIMHIRVYDRSAAGAPQLEFDVSTGCFNGENPSEALRSFAVPLTAATPTLPWSTANMTTVPDDGTFTFTSTMGLVDVAAKVSGSANTWVDFEAWFTAEYA